MLTCLYPGSQRPQGRELQTTIQTSRCYRRVPDAPQTSTIIPSLRRFQSSACGCWLGTTCRFPASDSPRPVLVWPLCVRNTEKLWRQRPAPVQVDPSTLRKAGFSRGNRRGAHVESPWSRLQDGWCHFWSKSRWSRRFKQRVCSIVQAKSRRAIETLNPSLLQKFEL